LCPSRAAALEFEGGEGSVFCKKKQNGGVRGCEGVLGVLIIGGLWAFKRARPKPLFRT